MIIDNICKGKTFKMEIFDFNSICILHLKQLFSSKYMDICDLRRQGFLDSLQGFNDNVILYNINSQLGDICKRQAQVLFQLELTFLDVIVCLSHLPTAPPHSHCPSVSCVSFSFTVDCREGKFQKDKVRLLSHSSHLLQRSFFKSNE